MCVMNGLCILRTFLIICSSLQNFISITFSNAEISIKIPFIGGKYQSTFPSEVHGIQSQKSRFSISFENLTKHIQSKISRGETQYSGIPIYNAFPWRLYCPLCFRGVATSLKKCLTILRNVFWLIRFYDVRRASSKRA